MAVHPTSDSDEVLTRLPAEQSREPRPIGRERIVRVTEARLRAGVEVRVADICAEAEVSPALIYKYFTDRDDLIAEAYGRIIMGFIDADRRDLRENVDFRTPALEEQLRAFIRVRLSQTRDDERWTRLEALAHGRVNPGVAKRVGAVRQEFVDELAGMALVARPGWDAMQARSFAILALGMSIGLTAMTDIELEDGEREALSSMWAGLLQAPFRPSA